MSKKILIADDSSIIQVLSKKIFQGLNFEVTGVKDGNDVLKNMESTDYDVILMDINLPGTDGMNLSKQIRKLKNRDKANTPIIAISGNYKNYSMDDFKNAGINEFHKKPLNYDALVESVQKYTKKI